MKSFEIVLGSLVLSACGIGLGTELSSAVSKQTQAVRKFEFRYVVRIPRIPAGTKMLRLWIPVPRSDKYQSITRLRIDSPISHTVHRDPEYGNNFLYFGAAATRFSEPFTVQMHFQVVRREHRVALQPNLLTTHVGATGGSDNNLHKTVLFQDTLFSDGLASDKI